MRYNIIYFLIECFVFLCFCFYFFDFQLGYAQEAQLSAELSRRSVAVASRPLKVCLS